ncbi:MAG: nicotinate (nicotinamide) nucleotide adenylyltransferase [Bacteroides sp.]|nr:nicotinate (nicotinamide) nucleotide adenylyltransferase [Bacteroides sp.]MCM1379863.1 nicotinate (nicotinamide) nucleotide adenylyltransferase [Bacteroides sp.]MCM1446105.1 nicotinate (nicotinamide) nucleotide adenylyltransferase [Prevotella sp.]
MICTGIFGGTFNPVHKGHIALAQWLVDTGIYDEVWLTLSPANPLKNDRPGASDTDRKEMLKLACEGHNRLKPCFAEFDMPRPSYTVNTLRRLAEKYPDRQFSLIIGADNWQIFSRWREPQAIISDFGITIYPRPGYDVATPQPNGVTYAADAPQCAVSSSEIRAGLDTTLLDTKVKEYISAHNLYGQTKTLE